MLISKTNKTHQTSSANGDVLSSLEAHKSKDFSFLKQIKLKQVAFWDFASNVIQTEATKYKFKLVKLSDLIAQRKGFFTIDDEKEYKRCKVQLYARGVILRDIVKGKEIKTKKQQACKKDDFLVAEIDAKVGGYGIVPSELENAVVSSHYYLYEIDTAKLLPEFLGLYVKTEEFATQIKATGSTNYASIRPAQVLDYQIPLPPIATQEKLVADYNAQMLQAEKFEAQAKDLEKEIETYLLKELGIKIQQTEKKDWQGFKFLQPANLKELSRWDVKSLYGNSSNPFDTEKFDMVKLLDYFELNPKTNFHPELNDGEISFIPMENVSDEYGEVIESREIEVKKVKGYTKFQNNDLIWAKITPCMQNGKSAIVSNLKNGLGCGSTEFYVFRAKTDEKWLVEFLYVLGRSQYLRKSAMSYFTGSAGQQRVSSNFFKTLEIPLPNAKIREKIVKHIHMLKAKIKTLKTDAESLRRKAKTDFESELFEM